MKNKMTMFKKHFFASLLLISFWIANPNSSKAQVVIIKPSAPAVVIERPSRPSARHFWRDGEWEWRSARQEYVWVPARWESLDRDGVWIPGHWAKRPRGWVWVAGHWRR